MSCLSKRSRPSSVIFGSACSPTMRSLKIRSANPHFDLDEKALRPQGDCASCTMQASPRAHRSIIRPANATHLATKWRARPLLPLCFRPKPRPLARGNGQSSSHTEPAISFSCGRTEAASAKMTNEGVSSLAIVLCAPTVQRDRTGCVSVILLLAAPFPRHLPRALLCQPQHLRPAQSRRRRRL